MEEPSLTGPGAFAPSRRQLAERESGGKAPTPPAQATRGEVGPAPSERVSPAPSGQTSGAKRQEGVGAKRQDGAGAERPEKADTKRGSQTGEKRQETVGGAGRRGQARATHGKATKKPGEQGETRWRVAEALVLALLLHALVILAVVLFGNLVVHDPEDLPEAMNIEVVPASQAEKLPPPPQPKPMPQAPKPEPPPPEAQPPKPPPAPEPMPAPEPLPVPPSPPAPEPPPQPAPEAAKPPPAPAPPTSTPTPPPPPPKPAPMPEAPPPPQLQPGKLAEKSQAAGEEKGREKKLAAKEEKTTPAGKGEGKPGEAGKRLGDKAPEPDKPQSKPRNWYDLPDDASEDQDRSSPFGSKLSPHPYARMQETANGTGGGDGGAGDGDMGEVGNGALQGALNVETTQSTRDFLLGQILRKWKRPPGDWGPDAIVGIRVQIMPDGSLGDVFSYRAPWMPALAIKGYRDMAPGDPRRMMLESVYTALRLAQPLTLPPELKAKAPFVATLNFRPADVP